MPRLTSAPAPKAKRKHHPGRGKGGSWEREVARRLSLWITDGARDDCLWRSAMSGGRATVQIRKGVANSAQVGDLSAISPEGAAFLQNVVVECKFHKDLVVLASLLTGSGKLSTLWAKHHDEATAAQREPFMVAKENRIPALLLTTVYAARNLDIRTAAPITVSGWKGTGLSRVLVYVFDDVVPTLQHWRDHPRDHPVYEEEQ